MKVAIFGKYITKDFKPVIVEIFERLQSHQVKVSIFEPFYNNIVSEAGCSLSDCEFFNRPDESPEKINFLITIGGDGTFLESMIFLKSSNVPVIGLNLGRLGYLANVGRDEIARAFDSIFAGNYNIEKRSLLRLESSVNLFEGFNFALNEVTVQKSDSSLITIDTYINDDFVNTYWTDGLIIATPTGSTAYSLSVGGPIVVPGSRNFIIAPIASHNLSVRPIVVPDDVIIKMVVSVRNNNFLVTADNRTQQIDDKYCELFVRKSKFTLQMVKLPFNNYFSTLRNKLMWGADKRNFSL